MKGEGESRLEFLEEALGGPAFLGKEVLEPGAVAAFAQSLLVAEDFRDGFDDAQSLVGKYEGIKAQRKMRFIGETAAYAKRVANLAVMFRGSERNVVDLGIGAPGRAAR